MGLSIWQIIGLTLLAYWKTFDWQELQITAFDTIVYGALAGIICGDFQIGLVTGATLQLMSLGVAALGGSSMPDYPVAAIISVAVAVTTGKGMAAGMALGVPVGMLTLNLDVVVKLINSWIANKAQKAADEHKFKKMNHIIPISFFMMPLESAIPVFIAVVFGKPLVNAILNFMPKWFTTGLNVTGAMLPAVGIAMLLTYLPLKKYGYWLLVGFVLAAYLKMPTLGVAILGVAAAIPEFRNLVEKKNNIAAASNTGNGLSQEDMEDE